MAAVTTTTPTTTIAATAATAATGPPEPAHWLFPVLVGASFTVVMTMLTVFVPLVDRWFQRRQIAADRQATAAERQAAAAEREAAAAERVAAAAFRRATYRHYERVEAFLQC
ncbi:hypothetical protein SLS55_002128 [Diplodia seriata]|uniref:Uncharacterized protein n=1 Tax=Diplodia seriata TaxID=420778 RepID=A0ABR3CRB4_9PEZI